VSLLQNERLIPILLGLPFLVTFMAAAWGIFK